MRANFFFMFIIKKNETLVRTMMIESESEKFFHIVVH
jgi:hypothetical protein